MRARARVCGRVGVRVSYSSPPLFKFTSSRSHILAMFYEVFQRIVRSGADAQLPTFLASIVLFNRETRAIRHKFYRMKSKSVSNHNEPVAVYCNKRNDNDIIINSDETRKKE